MINLSDQKLNLLKGNETLPKLVEYFNFCDLLCVKQKFKQIIIKKIKEVITINIDRKNVSKRQDVVLAHVLRLWWGSEPLGRRSIVHSLHDAKYSALAHVVDLLTHGHQTSHRTTQWGRTHRACTHPGLNSGHKTPLHLFAPASHERTARAKQNFHASVEFPLVGAKQDAAHSRLDFDDRRVHNGTESKATDCGQHAHSPAQPFFFTHALLQLVSQEAVDNVVSFQTQRRIVVYFHEAKLGKRFNLRSEHFFFCVC